MSQNLTPSDVEDRSVRLLVSCADQPGIVAAVSGFLSQRGANILTLDQHASEPVGGRFFQRLEFLPAENGPGLDTLRSEFGREVGQPLAMEWAMPPSRPLKRVALLVSKADHALVELLWLHRRGELPCEINQVISNHPDCRPVVEFFGHTFRHEPVTRDTKPQQEARLLEHLADGTDLVVLARYMQILTPQFIAHYPHRIINIHHSFLPAFIGADPYRRAYERGVKLIGATAHYATEDLDEGPIIEQDVSRVNHRHTVEQLKELGRGVERDVLARAVRWHLEDRVLVDEDHRTVVFH